MLCHPERSAFQRLPEQFANQTPERLSHPLHSVRTPLSRQGLVAAKEKEIAANSEAIEEKTKRLGEARG